MKDILKSKKFVAACVGVVGVVLSILLGKMGVMITDAQVVEFLAPIVGFVVGQGIADHGKEAAKIAAASRAERLN